LNPKHPPLWALILKLLRVWRLTFKMPGTLKVSSDKIARMQKMDDHLSDQARKEAEFFDRVYAETDAKHRLENYVVPDEIVRQVTRPGPRPLLHREYACSLLGSLKGKRLLDYGAGDGWNTVCFAKAGAKVWAIDISQKSIELTRKKAAANGVAGSVVAEVRDACRTRFPSAMFDVIYGGGILHHLDVRAAAPELCRILRPDGVAVFYEPIRETRAMDVVKALALRLLNRRPKEVTGTETPLTRGRIALLRPWFEVVRYRQFEVLSSANALIPSRTLKWFLLWADDLLMRCLPAFAELGRAVVIELRRPLKGGDEG